LLAGKRFGSNTKVIDEINAHFEGLENSYYTDNIKKVRISLE